MYIAADCCLQTDTVSVMLSVLLYSILSVQIVYSVQLNCTDSNTERQSESYVEHVTVQHI